MDHTVVHFEIPANNTEKLGKFYAELFGWKVEKMPGPADYWIIMTVPLDEKMSPLRPGVNGALYKVQNTCDKPRNYISVESIDKYTEKVKALGGKIEMPKQEVPGVGWVAIVLDPEGNQFALLQPVSR